ncbi:MAG: hypothetical protein E6G34_00900 [Actinobacteria bacterium]|nr:MAG: hypothetical protein E6G34_00900 [Actinomycetota bacterium]
MRGTSAQLQGSINPNGATTTYYFQFGPTVAYGAQTTSASLPASIIKIKVGRPVSGLLSGYHYRLVASNSFGTAYGHDRTFFARSSRARIVIARERTEPPTVYGSTLTLRGSLVGPGSAGRLLVLERSPFPFLAPFEEFGAAPATTSAAGAFLFRVPSLTANTQLRVHTLDPRPLFSPIVTIHVAARVTLKVRKSKNGTLVRLYGTVTPAKVGARVLLQVIKAVRPTGSSERTSRFATQFATVAKRATRSFSRFSLVTRVKRTGRYRAYVPLRKGPLVSGTSRTVFVHATPAPPRKSKRKP